MNSPLRLQDLSGQNRAQVIELFRRHKLLSRQEIADLTGLSWGGMTKIVARLLEEGILTETVSEVSGPGRKPHSLSLCRDDNLVAGLDINLEGLGGVVVNLAGEPLGSFARPNSQRDAASLRALILDFAQELLSAFPGKRFLALGIAMQGSVDAGTGTSVIFPRFPDWHSVPIGDMLNQLTGLPVRLEHDPDCILSSVLPKNSADNALLLRIDHSIGMAVALNGQLLRGPGVLEIAHITADPNGPVCGCGRRGCLDVYTSACLNGDEYCPEAVAVLIPHLTRALSNCACLFRPKRIYLTGKLMCHHDRFRAELESCIRDDLLLRDIPVTCFTDDNRVERGAADLAIDQLLREGKL